MATLQGIGIPRVKLESAPDESVKRELSDTPSPFPDEDAEMDEDDAGDLDFSQAQQQLWLSNIPKTLWERLAKLQDEDEVEIGKIRVEGQETNPSRVRYGPLRIQEAQTRRGHAGNVGLYPLTRIFSKQVSLILYPTPAFENEPREYNLFAAPPEKQRSRRPGQAFVFSERDLPGYKPKAFSWDDVDEDGNPGQGRSFLYERHRREQKKKENKGRFIPYARRPIPKQTAIAGTVAREFEAVPVKNDEFFALEKKRTAQMLKVREQEEALFKTGDDDPEKRSRNIYMGRSEAQAAAKVRELLLLPIIPSQPNPVQRLIKLTLVLPQANQARKHAAKENRAARVDKHVLIDKLLELFRQHRIWGLRDLKSKVNQPEAYLRDTLNEIAFMWKQGDFNGKWELKPEFKMSDDTLMNPTGVDVAPKEVDTDAEMGSGMGSEEGEGSDVFEDVG